jgi:uncharacterized protein (TIGR03083 family)
MADAQTLTKDEIWRLIHEQRSKTADMLVTLTPEEWNAQSLCSDWTVRDVAAHCIETQLMTPGRFFALYLSSGFRFHAMSARIVKGHRDEPISYLLEQFQKSATRSTGPPGPPLTPLGEAVIHGEDMARPLGKRIDVSPEALTAVADYAVRTTPLLHGKERSAGLRLRATDIEWSQGDGPEVSGPAASLIMAVVGRSQALGDLAGDGVDVLRKRM